MEDLPIPSKDEKIVCDNFSDSDSDDQSDPYLTDQSDPYSSELYESGDSTDFSDSDSSDDDDDEEFPTLDAANQQAVVKPIPGKDTLGKASEKHVVNCTAEHGKTHAGHEVPGLDRILNNEI